ncbi:hypothetical protein C8R41DRAFT_865395 [Lentinula lateritia]|uniref:F-box domain-containing protein n=1 Tax=Lentinula lateritia TaxID=40482 RepID=A0ABQ8VQA6_9AGAR|nr:hypothetical protein C8R41DRAFT_865395 [Lentinula lateritia]
MYNTRNSSRTSSKIRIGDTEAFVLSSDDSEVENFKTKYISNYLNTNDKGPSSGNVAHPQSSSRIVKRGNRGKLEGILKLPLDLELEIYSYLEPLDLLRLSRTSKDLRVFLMSRSNAIVWRAARSNVPDLPPLPSDLSEPECACVNLARPSSGNVAFVAAIDVLILRRFYSRSNLHSVWKRSYASTFIVFKAAAEYIPCVKVAPWKGPWNGEDKVFFPPNVRTLRHKYRQVRKGEMGQEEWVAQQKQLYEEITEHTAACSGWQKVNNDKRAEELQITRSKRKSLIYNKLQALGWGDEIDRLDAEGSTLLSTHKSVRQAKDLTDKAWTGIQPQLVKLLEESQQRRL